MSLRRRSPYWNLWPSPTLLRKKLGVRLLPCLTFPIVGMYILHNILHLMTWAQKQRRSTTKVTKNFVQCLHLARRYIVSPPWQFLAPPDLPLQQGSDRLNCNSKHLLMLYEYVVKLYFVRVYTSMSNMRAYFGVIWASNRSRALVWPHLRRRS